MSRPKRSAAISAEKKIKAVLDWEDLPESSKKFKLYAAKIDAEFEEEQKNKRVRVEDLEISDDDEEPEENEDCADMASNGTCSVHSCKNDIPTQEDLDFIEHDSGYESSDAEFVSRESDVDSLTFSEEETEEEEDDEVLEEIDAENDTDNEVREASTDNNTSIEHSLEQETIVDEEEEDVHMVLDINHVRGEEVVSWDEPIEDVKQLRNDETDWSEHMLTLNQTYIC